MLCPELQILGLPNSINNTVTEVLNFQETVVCDPVTSCKTGGSGQAEGAYYSKQGLINLPHTAWLTTNISQAKLATSWEIKRNI